MDITPVELKILVNLYKYEMKGEDKIDCFNFNKPADCLDYEDYDNFYNLEIAGYVERYINTEAVLGSRTGNMYINKHRLTEKGYEYVKEYLNHN